MRKVILIIAIAFVALAATAQTEYQLTETLIPNDQKTQFILERASTSNYAMLPTLMRFAQEEQERAGTVVNLEAVKPFYVGLNKLVEDYIKAVSYEDTTTYVEYPSDYAIQGSVQNGNVLGYEFYKHGDTLMLGVIESFDKAQVKIDETKLNPDLDFVGGANLIAELEAKKAKLVAVYQKLVAIKNE